MARAKSTDRSEARRRHRAALAEVHARAADEVEEASEATTVGRAGDRAQAPRPSPGASARPGPGPRPGIAAAFRQSIRQADIRADIRALPTIIRTTKSFWVPALVIAGAGVIAFAGGIDDQLGALVFQLVLYPPPMVVTFLAGMLTSRGSYLMGGIAGFLSAAVVALVVLSQIDVPQPGTDTVLTAEAGVGFAMWGFVTSTSFGLLVGAFAGFYRRFLAISGPQRPQQRRQQPQRRRAGSLRPGTRR